PPRPDPPGGHLGPGIGVVAVVEDEQLPPTVALAGDVREHPVGVAHACARILALCSRFAAWYRSSASAESTSPSVGWFGTRSCAAGTPKRFASTAPSEVVFISPKPGRAPLRARSASPPPPSAQPRAACPTYSSEIVAQSSCTRFDMFPGKRCTAGFSRKAASSAAGCRCRVLHA